jgi:hypothetical protein
VIGDGPRRDFEHCNCLRATRSFFPSALTAIARGGNDGYVDEAESLGNADRYPHYIIVVFCQFWKIFPGTEQWTFLIVPLADESLLKLRNRGPLYLDVGITPELQGGAVCSLGVSPLA